MQMINFLQLNELDIRKFLKLVLSIQLAIIGLIVLDILGFQIPILKEVTAIIYLIFIPGILVLRILRIKGLSNIENLVFTFGLSIASLMFIGFLMNLIYPLIGIKNPISIIPLTITISTVVIVLSILCYFRDKNSSNSVFNNMKLPNNYLSAPALFLYILPFVSILGTYIMNYYEYNLIQMILIILIGIITLLIGFDKFIPKNLYPLAIFVISISLLFHRSLISMYLNGWDINTEYYFSNLVVTNSYWDFSLNFNYNSMLSIAMFAPIISIISGIDLVWIFKIIYPLLFTLVPIGLYKIFQKQTNKKIAFLSCIFLIFISSFYAELTALAKQMIGEIFLVAFLLVLVNEKLNGMKKSFLSIIFIISLIVSHYGLSYIFIILLILTYLILKLSPTLVKVKNIICPRLEYNAISFSSKPMPLSSTFMLLFVIFLLTWYMYMSSSSLFDTVLRIGNQITGSIFSELLNPQFVEGARYIQSDLTPLRNISKYLHLITQLFIGIGIITLVLNSEKFKFRQEFIVLALVSFLMLLSSIIVPYLSNTLGTSRIYHINVLFLAPFCIIGFISIFNAIAKILRRSWPSKNALKVISIFLVIFLMFNTEFVYQITGDDPKSISLNTDVDYPSFDSQESFGAEWIMARKTRNSIYADNYMVLLLSNYDINSKVIPHYFKGIPDRGYVFLGKYNVLNEKIRIVEFQAARNLKSEYINTNLLIENKNKLYDNGKAQVFLNP